MAKKIFLVCLLLLYFNIFCHKDFDFCHWKRIKQNYCRQLSTIEGNKCLLINDICTSVKNYTSCEDYKEEEADNYHGEICQSIIPYNSSKKCETYMVKSIPTCFEIDKICSDYDGSLPCSSLYTDSKKHCVLYNNSCEEHFINCENAGDKCNSNIPINLTTKCVLKNNNCTTESIKLLETIETQLINTIHFVDSTEQQTNIKNIEQSDNNNLILYKQNRELEYIDDTKKIETHTSSIANNVVEKTCEKFDYKKDEISICRELKPKTAQICIFFNGKCIEAYLSCESSNTTDSKSCESVIIENSKYDKCVYNNITNICTTIPKTCEDFNTDYIKYECEDNYLNDTHKCYYSDGICSVRQIYCSEVKNLYPDHGEYDNEYCSLFPVSDSRKKCVSSNNKKCIEIDKLKINNNNNNSKYFDCNGIQFFKGECSPNITNKEENFEYIEHILERIDEGLFNDIFEEVIEEDTNYIEEENNITYQISTISSQYLTNLSKVSLENCESKLKEIYSIDDNDKLILFKLEYDIEEINIPIIEYQLFTKDGSRLNLSYCNEIQELISIPVVIDEDKEFIHNPKSDFYQDKCFTYTSEHDTDLTIYDRKNDFNEKFLSLCEINCEYQGYNDINKSVTCECRTKTDFPNFATKKDIDLKDILYHFIDVKKLFHNLYVISCTKTLFCSKGFKTNSGSYINIIMIILNILLIIFFGIKGYYSFQKKMNFLLNLKLGNDNNPNETSHNIAKSEDNIFSENNININNVNLKKVNIYNDYEINNLEYSQALNLENNKKNFFEIYKSQIKMNHIIIYTFFINDDYNSTTIKICLFLFWLCSEFFISCLFFNDKTMHKIYEDEGTYNLFYQLPKIIYSILISKLLIYLLTFLSIIEKPISKIIQEKETKSSIKKNIIYNMILYLKYKLIIFFILIIISYLLFWYYLSSFCAVFKNSQIPLIKDTLNGYICSLLYPFIFTFIPSGLRYYSLRIKNKGTGKYLYKCSNIFSSILEFLF